MAKRKIIKIDEAKCNGCGDCIPNCKEGALAIVDGKAKLVSEVYCDGLGACLGHCPQGAITIEERDAAAFDPSTRPEFVDGLSQGQSRARLLNTIKPRRGIDEKKVGKHLKKELPCGCPGSMVIDMRKGKDPGCHDAATPKMSSELRQWPVQIKLVPPSAPYFKNADLLIAADCVPFAYPNFHAELLQGKILLVGCPKLDDIGLYKEKIAAIIKNNDIRSVTHAHMEVPCCFGLIGIIEDAITESGKKIPFKDITVSIKGEIK